MGFKIASGVVDITLKGVSRALGGLRKLGAGLRGIAVQAGTLIKRIAAVGAAFASLGLGFAIKKASDAQETLDAFSDVFRDQAEAASQFADDLGKSIGRSALTIKEGLIDFQAFFVGLGFGAEEARRFSQQMKALSLDLASFRNLADEDAQNRFIQALAGSSEVLIKFGIDTKVAALEQEALAAGFKGTTKDLTEQQKAILRMRVIMKAMTDQGAVGNAVKTQGSFANQAKRLKGNLLDLAVTIGQAVLPAATAIVQMMNQNREALISFGKRAGDVFAFLAKGFVFVAKVVSNFGEVARTVWTAFKDSAIISVNRALAAIIGFGNHALSILKKVFSFNTVKRFFTLIAEGFVALVESIENLDLDPLERFGGKMANAITKGFDDAIKAPGKTSIERALEQEAAAAERRLGASAAKLTNLLGGFGPQRKDGSGSGLNAPSGPLPSLSGNLSSRAKSTKSKASTGFSGRTFGLDALFTQIQEAVSGKENDTAKKHLEESKKQSGLQERIAADIAQIKALAGRDAGLGLAGGGP